jgi:hypothetical protein
VDDRPEVRVAGQKPLRRHRPRTGKTGEGRPSAFGKYAGIIPSSEEFIREKQREVAHEDGRKA